MEWFASGIAKRPKNCKKNCNISIYYVADFFSNFQHFFGLLAQPPISSIPFYQRDSHGRTALHRAARAGNEEVVWKMLNGDLSSADELVMATDKVCGGHQRGTTCG